MGRCSNASYSEIYVGDFVIMSLIAWLALLGPVVLVAAAVSFKTAPAIRAINDRAVLAATFALAVALATMVAVIINGPMISKTLGFAGIGFGLYIDMLSAIMFLLVSFVGLVVMRYSRTYLDGDPRQSVFMTWLLLTLAAILTVIISGNLAQFILAWVATSVGLNKLLLFYGERQAAQLAAKKKFIASRIGDVCLIGAAILLLSVFGTLEFSSLFAQAKLAAASGQQSSLVGVVAVLIVVAALLKSAQLPMHGWLIEVMETPTPVSALLHAGIINAGGFLVLRMADMLVLSGMALDILAIVGGVTALFGSVVMLTQTSVKVSLAYSTIAQMGFMMLQCGLGAFSTALLHIVAHSLYKAHAFLSSGSVIDLARASWTPSPGGQPHPARLVLALCVVLAIGAGVATLFGATITQKPGAFTLAAIMVMGLVLLISNAIDERSNSFVLARTGMLAAAVAVAYFALQAGFEWLLATSLPKSLPLRGSIGLVIIILVVLAFGAITMLQSLMVGQGKASRWQAWHSHVSSGFYLNTIANRLVLRFWPRRTA